MKPDFRKQFDGSIFAEIPYGLSTDVWWGIVGDQIKFKSITNAHNSGVTMAPHVPTIKRVCNPFSMLGKR